MKVLHLIPRYLPAVGGAEIHLAAISEHLVRQGHEVTVATTDALDIHYFWQPDGRRTPIPEETLHGVLVRRFPVRHLPFLPHAYHGWRRGIWLLNRAGAPVQLLHRLARQTPAVPALDRWLTANAAAYDLIAGMNVGYETFLESGRRAARAAGRPFVVYPLTHLGAGPEPAADKLGSFYTMRHQVATIRQADLLVAQTPTEQNFYTARGLPAGRSIVVGPGIWPAEIAGGDGGRARRRHELRGPVILSLGTLSAEKGTVQLLDAFARLAATGQPADLVLAGTIDPSLRPRLERLAHPRVRVLERVGEDEKRDLLAAADLFVMTSRVDSFGLVYLEAWAYGLPVIGAKTWGPADLIEDGRDGRLVPFGDPAALAEVIGSLLDNPAERVRLGGNGRKKMEAHAWPAKLAAIETAYRQLVGEREG